MRSGGEREVAQSEDGSGSEERSDKQKPRRLEGSRSLIDSLASLVAARLGR